MDLLPEPQGDVKVTQLLRMINHHFPPKNSLKHIPHSYCYVCSKLDPDGRFMGNPYKYIFGRGYLQRCEHIPPAPHPTVLGDSRPNTVSSDDDGKYFDTRILNSDSLPGDTSTRFKIPPVFDKDHLRDRAGRVLPLVSENTFQSTNPQRSEANGHYVESNRNYVESSRNKGDGTRFSLPSLPSGKQPALVSRNSYQENETSVARHRGQEETSSRGGSFAADHRSHYDSENSMGVRGKVDQKGRRHPASKGGFTSRTAGVEQWADEEESEGVMKYQHRKKEDWVKLSGPSKPFDDSKPNYPRSSNSKELLFGASGSRDFMDSPSGSPQFRGSPQFSRGSAESSPDFVFSRMKSASWCECPDVDVSSLRCRECFRTDGHEKWCVSKLGICPNCNKPVRRKHSRDRFRRQGTHSPMAARNPTDLSVESSWHNREDCSSKKQEDQRVRFHDSENNSFVKEKKKKKRGGILKHDTESGFGFTEEVNLTKRLKRAEDSVNPAVPRVNPNVHKRAYLLALADARLRKLTKDPWSLESAFKRRYFSYFPLYKRPGFKATAEVGIRTEEDVRRGKKLKIKKGMKHIFGDIDLADYYPKTKRIPKESKVAV